MLNREYIYYCRIFEVKSDKTRLIKNILLKHIKGVFLHLDSAFYGRILEGFAPPPTHTHTHTRPVRPWTILLANISYFCDADFPSFCFACIENQLHQGFRTSVCEHSWLRIFWPYRESLHDTRSF